MDKKDYIDLLMKDPFSLEKRLEFVRYLLATAAFQEANEQNSIVLKQDSSNEEALKIKDQLAAFVDSPGTTENSSSKAAAQLTTEEKGIKTNSKPVLNIVQGGSSQSKSTDHESNVQQLPVSNQIVRMSDIVGMEKVKKAVRLKIVEPFANPSLFAKFGKRSGGGVLLYGPPGCGKTMLAKAIASECQAEFISVDISDILNMYVGESEANLREIFETARANKPSVLFFDELDALAISRSKSRSDHTRTLVNEFLAQLDGIKSNNDKILILGATNMPWDIDGAFKRPGRFSKHFFVPPLDSDARKELFKLRTSVFPCENLDYNVLSEQSELFSGADIEGVLEEAKENVLSEMIDLGKELSVSMEDILSVIRDYNPSCLDWLKTVRNIVKFGGVDRSYKDVAAYLKTVKLI